MSRIPERVPEIDKEVLADLLRAVNLLAHDPDHLPLFQHCLFWFWVKATGSGDTAELSIPDLLTADHLKQAVGPMNALRTKDRVANLLTDCLDHQANVSFDNLSADDQDGARRLLSALGIKDEQQRYKRTPLRLSRLPEIGLTREDCTRIRDRFNDPHPYLRETANDEIDICHEALIRKWKKLRDWIHEEYERASLYRKVCETYAAWKAAGSPKANKELLLYKKYANDASEAKLFAEDQYDLEAEPATENGTPLALERLYAWDADPLGIRKQPSRLVSEHASMREYVDSSLDFHQGQDAKDKRRRWLTRGAVTAVLVVAGIGVLFWYETDLLERESRAFQSFAIAATTYQGFNEESPERRLVALWKGVTADRLFEEKPGKWAMFDKLPVEGTRKARLFNAQVLSEGRLADLFRQALNVPITQAKATAAPPSKLATMPPGIVANGNKCEAGGKTVLEVTSEKTITRGGKDLQPLFGFHPESKVVLSSGCEVIVAAVPILDSVKKLRKLELTFVAWRQVNGAWEATAIDQKGQIARLGDVVDVNEVALEDEFTVAIKYTTLDQKVEPIRVVSLRRDPWPGLISPGNALTKPDVTQSPRCNYLDKALVDVRINSKQFYSYTSDRSIVCAALLAYVDDTPRNGLLPQAIELFVIPNSGPIGDHHKVPTARISFYGPKITRVRLGESGPMTGWLELSTSADDANQVQSSMTYLAPARLPALTKAACKALYASPVEVRQSLAKLAGGWGLEYELILKANPNLTKYHELVNTVTSDSSESEYPCNGKEKVS